VKRPAPNEYLDELIDYGGEPYTRREAVEHMQSIGGTRQMIDRWLQGNDLARERRPTQPVSLRLFIQQTPPNQQPH
jgi:hypothetical protein